MRVELVNQKYPPGFGVCFKGEGRVIGKVAFFTGGQQRWSNDLARRYFPVCNQATSPMTNVLKLLQFDLARPHRMVRIGSLPGRNARHLVGTNHMRPGREQVSRLVVQLAYGLDLLGKGLGIIGLGI